MILLELEKLGFQNGSKEILKNITWQVSTGEHWAILGSNGCGKTTLASIISGYHTYTAGTYKMKGEIVKEATVENVRNQIGFVSTSFFSQYLRHENGFNIVLGGYYGALCEHEICNDTIYRKAKLLLRAFQMETKGMYPFDLLSKGQQQKVMLCRAFMRNYPILMLDEPCSGLDILSKEKVCQILQYYVQHKETSIIYITHHTDEILPFFTHVLLLKEGQIFYQGEKHTVLTDNILSEFFEEPTKCSWQEDDTVSIRIKKFDRIDSVFA